MRALKQNLSIRSQSALIIFLLAIGWLVGGSFNVGFHGAEGVVDIIFWAVPLFTLILVVSYFLSGRQHKAWFFTAIAAVVISFVIMVL